MKYTIPALVLTMCAGMVFGGGDGSDEPGFQPVPHQTKLPSAPPRTIASSEQFIAGGCCCAMSRTEPKSPPRPPVMLTKLTE